MTDAIVTCETVGDFIKISQQDSWELMINVRKGAIEGWKVSSFLFIFGKLLEYFSMHKIIGKKSYILQANKLLK